MHMAGLTNGLSSLVIASDCYRDEESDKIGFRGWARMAAPIDEFTIIEVRKPNVGENKPADVTADIVIDTSSKHCLFHPACLLDYTLLLDKPNIAANKLAGMTAYKVIDTLEEQQLCSSCSLVSTAIHMGQENCMHLSIHVWALCVMSSSWMSCTAGGCCLHQCCQVLKCSDGNCTTSSAMRTCEETYKASGMKPSCKTCCSC